MPQVFNSHFNPNGAVMYCPMCGWPYVQFGILWRMDAHGIWTPIRVVYVHSVSGSVCNQSLE